MKPIKFQYCSQAVKVSLEFPARRFKPVKWKGGWGLAKPNGELVGLRDLE